MKLRINAKLRAALIAAITAVGFSLPQAAASTVLDGQTYSGDVYTWSNGESGQVDLAFGGWKKTTQGDSGYIYGNAITTWKPTIMGIIANGGSTTFSSDLNTIRFATDVGSNTNMKYTFFPLSVGGIIAENAGYTITASGGNRAVYIGNATATEARSDIKGNFTINTSGAGDNGTMTFMGTQTWNVASGATFTLNSGKYAKTVDGSLSITGDGTVNLTGVTVITKGSAIDVASGSSLVLNGTVNVMVDATDVVAPAAGTNGFGSAVADVPITGDGSLDTDGVTAWQINGGAATFNKDARTVSGETAVYFFQNADTADITAAAGATAVIVNTNNTTTAVSIGGDAHNWTELTINSGVVTTSHSNGSGCVSGDININAGGIFRVIGAHDAFGYSGSQTDNIIMKGSEGNTARLELNQNNDNSATMQTNIQMKGYSVITSTKAGGASRGFNTFGGNISAENKGNKIDRIEIRKDVTVTVAADGELDIAQMVLSGTSDGTRVLTKAGEGKLTFSGAAAMNALNLNAGSVEFNGATTINGNLTMVANTTVINTAALTFSNGGTIKIAQGGFSNSGTVNFSDTNVFDLSLLTDTEGVYTLFSGTSDVDLSKYNFTASNITGIDTTGKTWTFGPNGTISYTLSAQKVWDGSASNVWQDGSGDAWKDSAVFHNGDSAVFDETATNKQVLIQSAITAGSVTVSGQDYTFTMSSEGSLTATSISVTGGSQTVALGGRTLTADSVSVTGEGSSLQVTGAGTLNVSTIEGTLTVAPGAGNAVTMGNALSGTGALAVNGGGTVLLNGANTFTGGITVTGATVEMGNKSALGAENNAITIAQGGVIDLKGTDDVCYSYTLQGGTLKNTGGSTSTSHKQTKGLTLTADSTVGGTGNFYVLNSGYDPATVNLGGFKLTKTGSNTVGFYTVTFTNGGTLDVQDGALAFTVSNKGTNTITGNTTLALNVENSGTTDRASGKLNVGTTDAAAALTVDAQKSATISLATGLQNAGSSLIAIVSDEQTLTMSGVISGAGSLTKNGAGTLILSGDNTYTGDTVVNGGTLDIQGSISAGSKVKVAENATLAGKTGDISMSIDAEKTATIKGADGFSPKDSGITFASDDDIVTIENTGNAEITYSIGEANAKVTADTLVGTAEGAVTVENEVVVKEIVNYGGSPLTITHVDTETLQSIGAYMEGVTLQNVSAEPIVLKDITLLGTTVAVYQGGEEAAALEGSVTITDSLFAGASTLLANLEMADGSTLNVNGGNDMALTLGSKFTIADGSHVNLDETTIAALSQLQDGGKLDLIVAKEQTELSYGGNGYNGMSYDDLFVRTEALTGAYTVYANGDAFGLMKSTSPIPEPTTGTLSLLALMALAARRRRK